jgi:hypothetical protein
MRDKGDDLCELFSLVVMSIMEVTTARSPDSEDCFGGLLPIDVAQVKETTCFVHRVLATHDNSE